MSAHSDETSRSIDAVTPERPAPAPPVDLDRAKAELDAYVVKLAAGGLDEGTQHAADNLINAWVDAWLAELQVRRVDAHSVLDALIRDVAPQELAARLRRDGVADDLRHAEHGREQGRRMLDSATRKTRRNGPK
jgi:predicted negative regulator of RcsB-dependent stress response